MDEGVSDAEERELSFRGEDAGKRRLTDDAADHLVKALDAGVRGDEPRVQVELPRFKEVAVGAEAKGEEFDGIARELGATECSKVRWVPGA